MSGVAHQGLALYCIRLLLLHCAACSLKRHVLVTGEGNIAAVLGAIATFVGCVGGFSVISMDGNAVETISVNSGP